MTRSFSLSRDRAIAVVDIVGGHVGCALIALRGKERVILAHGRSKLSLEPRDDAHARARLAEEIAEATAAVSKIAPGIPVGEVFVVLHAPWSNSRVVSASALSKDDIEIKAAHIAKLADNALQSAPEIDRATLYEVSAVSVKMNGYTTNKPEGKRAHQVELAAVVSSVDPALRATIETALHAAFPVGRVSWRSVTRVYADALQRLVQISDAVVLDLGVFATSVSVYRDGVPSIEHAITEGLQSVLTRVHGTRPLEEVLSLFRMIDRDACADATCTSLQEALAQAEPELVKVFGEALAAIAETKRLPSDMLVIAHPDVGAWLNHFFARIDFTQFTTTALPFAVRIMSADDAEEWIGAKSGLDAALSLAAVHAVASAQST